MEDPFSSGDTSAAFFFTARDKSVAATLITEDGTGKAASETELVDLLLRNLNGTEIGNGKWRDEEDED